MPDLIDQLGDQLARLLGTGNGRTIISPAPGGGPEADRESNRTHRAGRIGEHITHGRDALGYGGHGDAVQEVDPDVSETVRRAIASAQRKGLHQPKPAGRIRLAQPFSPEAHIGPGFQFVAGPYGMFDGTLVAPAAGNSTQQIPVAFPANIPSPVMLLDRYPGALYMSVFVSSFAFVPTGTTMTGLQECFFTDAGGAVVGLGIFNPSNTSAAIYVNIGRLCNSPLTDPGTAQIGTINVTNIGIGGTPVSVRWQISVAYVAFYPDPWFNEQLVVPPMPADVHAYLRTSGAQGN